jgi:hypothetical protein
MVFSNLIITAYCIYPYFDPTSNTSGCVLLAVYQLLFLLAGIAHVRCSITDPGVVPRLQVISDEIEAKNCSKCEQLKPPRAHHCATCMRCVFKVRPPQLDHHCPWVNNCVGALNMKFFLQFCFYIAAVSCLTLFIEGCCISYAFSNIRRLRIKMLPLGLCVIVGIFAAIFLVFTVTVIVEQLVCVFKNQTYVEYLGKLRGSQCSKATALSLVFGKSSWFLPTSPKLVVDYSETVHRIEHKEREWDADSILLALGGSVTAVIVAGVLGLIYRLR